jgi:predicted CopG family antitoxin
MKTSTIDENMYNYFELLNEAEKKSIIEMIKTFLQSRKEASERISIEQYNKEIDEAESEIERGESYTQDDIVKISKQWINGK